jgi:hypothetical protein
MAGEEGEELLEIAAIGLQRLRREPPLVLQMAEPIQRRLPEARRRGDQKGFRGGVRHPGIIGG